jgi:hypothetical protein
VPCAKRAAQRGCTLCGLHAASTTQCLARSAARKISVHAANAVERVCNPVWQLSRLLATMSRVSSAAIFGGSLPAGTPCISSRRYFRTADSWGAAQSQRSRHSLVGIQVCIHAQAGARAAGQISFNLRRTEPGLRWRAPDRYVLCSSPRYPHLYLLSPERLRADAFQDQSFCRSQRTYLGIYI